MVVLRTCAENGRMPYSGAEQYGWMVCPGFETTFGEGPPTLEELLSVPEHHHGNPAAGTVVLSGLPNCVTVAAS